jgi:hypothetical protein
MEMTNVLRGAILLIVSTCVSVASGGAPMGLPMGTVDEGQWTIGGQFGRETADLEGRDTFDATYVGDGGTVTELQFDEQLEIQDLASNMLFVSFAYGILDGWDVFGRLGVADAQDDLQATYFEDGEFYAGPHSSGALDGSFGFAWGAGTRATFWQQGPWSLGGLGQFTWFNPGDSDLSYTDPILEPLGGTYVGEASLDYWQAQVSLALIYQADAWSFWGGPFVQFLEGEIERSGDILYDDLGVLDDGGDFSGTTDVEQDSQFGGHLGVGVDVAEQWNVWLEGQFTGDSWLIGIGAVFVPADTFDM